MPSPCLADGSCDNCANRVFIQYTLVVYDSAPTTFIDADGRPKIMADRVNKMYECCQCKTRYVLHEDSGTFVKA